MLSGLGISTADYVLYTVASTDHRASVQVTAAVLLYRAVTYLPPIPLGALACLVWRHGSARSPARPAGPPAAPPTAGTPPRGEQVDDHQQDGRANDCGQPGGEVEEPVQGVDVE